MFDIQFYFKMWQKIKMTRPGNMFSTRLCHNEKGWFGTNTLGLNKTLIILLICFVFFICAIKFQGLLIVQVAIISILLVPLESLECALIRQFWISIFIKTRWIQYKCSSMAIPRALKIRQWVYYLLNYFVDNNEGTWKSKSRVIGLEIYYKKLMTPQEAIMKGISAWSTVSWYRHPNYESFHSYLNIKIIFGHLETKVF